MDRTSYMHNLALRYFNGKIVRKDERELFAFINEDSRNLALFRKWERQWMATLSADTSIDREWRKLQTHILAKEAVTRTLPKRRSVSKKIISAAAFLFIAAGVFTATYLHCSQDNTPQTYFTNETPRGGKTRIILADGSSVWLNNSSSLAYSTDFNKDNRMVTLKGEGYFEVAPDSGNPFIVRTQGYDITVSGTKFNVSAYEDDPFISTTLIEGKVTVNYKDKSIDMLPGEEMKLIKSTGELQCSQVNATQSNTWIDNRLTDDNITFLELMNKLSRHFDVVIRIDDEKLARQTFSVSLRNEETLEQVFNALHKIVPFTVSQENQIYHIKPFNN